MAFAIWARVSAVITTCKSSALELRLGLKNDVEDNAVLSSSSLLFAVDLPSFTDPFPLMANFAPLSS